MRQKTEVNPEAVRALLNAHRNHCIMYGVNHTFYNRVKALPKDKAIESIMRRLIIVSRWYTYCVMGDRDVKYYTVFNSATRREAAYSLYDDLFDREGDFASAIYVLSEMDN